MAVIGGIREEGIPTQAWMEGNLRKKKRARRVPRPSRRNVRLLLRVAGVARGSIHLVTMGIGSLSGNDRQRILQREIQHGFGRQFDLLPFGCRLHAAAETATRGSSNAGALTTAGNTADNGADRRTGADLFRRVLAARTALTLVLIGLHTVGPAAHRNAVQLQHYDGLPGELARALDVDEVAFHVVTGRGGCFAIHG